MSTQASLLSFFTQMGHMGGVIVQAPVKLDLDLYIQNYNGRTRYDRLLFIGKTSVTLCVDALRAAMAEAKAGRDIARYREVWEYLRCAAPDDPDVNADDSWIEHTNRANKDELHRLEAELKAYRNNLIKESIRMGNEDLGRYFESCGDLTNAAEHYNRMRQDVTTTRHIAECGRHLVDIYLQRRDWNMVLNNLGKVTGLQNADDKTPSAYAKIISGIGFLGLARFRDAAISFLETDSVTPFCTYANIVSPNDIAIYGGLLALATMDRGALQARVLDNQTFRTFLEFEPHIRKAITLFVNGRYSNCLSILESYRNEYLLDIYLQKHIGEIYSLIRSKCIVQYFKPFSCVTLDSLNAAFAYPGGSVEDELVSMIQKGALKARIDGKNKLLVAVQPDARVQMQKRALEVASAYDLEAKEKLRRISIMTAGLEVVGQKQSHQAGVRSMRDEWMDELKASSSAMRS